MTALSMYHTFPEHEQRNAPILYHMFAKLELESNRPQEALKILASMSSSEPYSKQMKWKKKRADTLISLFADDQMPPPTSTLILKTREVWNHKTWKNSTKLTLLYVVLFPEASAVIHIIAITVRETPCHQYGSMLWVIRVLVEWAGQCMSCVSTCAWLHQRASSGARIRVRNGVDWLRYTALQTCHYQLQLQTGLTTTSHGAGACTVSQQHHLSRLLHLERIQNQDIQSSAAFTEWCGQKVRRERKGWCARGQNDLYHCYCESGTPMSFYGCLPSTVNCTSMHHTMLTLSETILRDRRRTLAQDHLSCCGSAMFSLN